MLAGLTLQSETVILFNIVKLLVRVCDTHEPLIIEL